jgi:flagellar biosynthesis GTPase FlhF
LVRQNYTRPDVIQLRGKWVDIDPRSWKTRKDLTVSVGLGTGNKDQQLQHLMMILTAQKEALQIGIASPENIYNSLVKLTQNAGFRNSEEFWTNPKDAPPQEPQEDPMVAVEREKLASQREMKQMEIQADQQKFQAETILKQQEAEKQLQQEQLRSQNDVAIEQARINAEMELERFKAQLSAEVELEKARIKVASDREIAMMNAAISNNSGVQDGTDNHT